MRVTRLYPSIVMLPFLLVACGGGGGDASTGGAAAAGDTYTVDPAEAAVITGVVRFEGTAPPPEPIDMSDEPTCAEKHATDGLAVRRPVYTNDNGTLRNVFVYIREGLGDRRFATSSEEKVLDQDGCIYMPHVIGVQTGQQLTIRNSDGLLHNVNARPQANASFNISQPRNMDSRRTFNRPEIMIPVRCDVHGWMESYIGVVDHPYYAVTGEDGSFRIENLPPGNYTVEAWHERLGTQTLQISVGPQETGNVTFAYHPPVASVIVPLGTPIDPHDHHPSAARSGGQR